MLRSLLSIATTPQILRRSLHIRWMPLQIRRRTPPQIRRRRPPQIHRLAGDPTEIRRRRLYTDPSSSSPSLTESEWFTKMQFQNSNICLTYDRQESFHLCSLSCKGKASISSIDLFGHDGDEPLLV